MLDGLYNTSQIIKISYSIVIRKKFWALELYSRKLKNHQLIHTLYLVVVKKCYPEDPEADGVCTVIIVSSPNIVLRLCCVLVGVVRYSMDL